MLKKRFLKSLFSISAVVYPLGVGLSTVSLQVSAAQTEFSAEAASRISRIVGGTFAPRHAYPWVVSLESTSGFQFCAGTLISPTKVLTAAHCTDFVPQAVVRVGTNSLAKGTLIAVASQKSHPKFNDSIFDYDVAIWTLKKPITLSAQVNLITLPDEGLVKPGTLLRTIGWGALTEGGISPTQLRQVDVPAVANEVCNQLISYGKSITTRMICAGFAKGGKDSCNGDSGGPLFGKYNATTRKAVQVGIVSNGDGCARPHKYGIYTRITNPEVRAFIKQETGI